MAAEPGAHQLGPAVAGEVAGEELALAAQLLALGVHVVHELVDQRDGDLLDLALGVGHLAHEDVAGGVDAAFGIGVEHGSPLGGELVQGDVVLDVFGDERAVLRRHGLEVAGGERRGWSPDR